MKTMMKAIAIFAIAAVSISCRDKAAEKRIAELETRLAQVEGNKTSAAAPAAGTTITPEATPAVEEKPEGPLPVMEFKTTDHDFGTIEEGKKVTVTYSIKNTGQAPLIIQNAQPSCGCTDPDWTKTPIPVGGEGFVKASFDSKGKPGMQNKTITVTANTWPKTTLLKFKAMVAAKPDGANGPAVK
jgi:poly(3-hydroxybutyrate) depolymerase